MFSKVTRSSSWRCAYFIEQPRVLHRDHRLGGEVFQQSDLLLGERSHLTASRHDKPKQGTVLTQRHAQHGADAVQFNDACAQDRPIIEFIPDIRDMDKSASPSNSVAVRRRLGTPVTAPQHSTQVVRQSPLGDRAKTFAVVVDLGSQSATSQRCIAFSSIASNTGVRLPGEALMTCNTSAVAVCCSSASRCSVSSRAFSIAITA